MTFSGGRGASRRRADTSNRTGLATSTGVAGIIHIEVTD
jgi:hypothetical protein